METTTATPEPCAYCDGAGRVDKDGNPGDAFPCPECSDPRPHRASYSPQDDKLRLFFAFRLPRAEWDALRAAGWVWTMKQDSDMCAPWTPAREDQALELADEIEDEDEPREARSADRAERFGGYMERREGEAEELADRYEGAPRVHAAQDEGRATRAAARHDRIGTRAASKWETAEYWAERTRGVIAHALYLERADVRHRRIKGIEAEIRGLEECTKKARTVRDLWRKVAAMTDAEKQTHAARHVANYFAELGEYPHPTNPARRPAGLWSMLREDQPDADRITGAQAAALYLESCGDLDGEGTPAARWMAHLRLRLAYEVQMLEAQGGTLANAEEIIPGGFIGRHQVVKVSKDRAGRVSRLYFLAPKGYGSNPEALVETGMQAEKLEPGAYRAPTPEELAAFKASQKARSAAKPKAPPLLNPDAESAQRIQDAWNAAALERCRAHARREGLSPDYYAPKAPSTVAEMTQAAYTAASGNAYSRAETVEVRADGTIYRPSWHDGEQGRKASPILCRLRVTLCGEINGARRVVVLTDKPRHKVPAFTPAATSVAVAS